MIETTIIAPEDHQTAPLPDMGSPSTNDAIAIGPASRAASQSVLRHNGDGTIDLSVLLAPGFALGDLARVVDTLTTANDIAGRVVFRLQMIGLTVGAIPSASNIDVNADCQIAEAARPTNVLVLSEILTDTFFADQALALQLLQAWLQAADAAGAHIGTVASGAVLLSRLGLMQGFACATPSHAGMLNHTATSRNRASVRKGGPASFLPDLFVIDRQRFTCAGGCATSDLMLHIVRQTLGDDVARQVTGQLLRDRARDASELQPHARLASGMISGGALQRALEVMRRHAEQPLELRAIAQRAGVHLRHLERLFRRHLSTSPREFYLRLRLQRARELMQGTTTTLASIARDVGFDSLSHFSKCYTEAYGTRPSEDRQRLFTSAINGPKSFGGTRPHTTSSSGLATT